MKLFDIRIYGVLIFLVRLGKNRLTKNLQIVKGCL